MRPTRSGVQGYTPVVAVVEIRPIVPAAGAPRYCDLSVVSGAQRLALPLDRDALVHVAMACWRAAAGLPGAPDANQALLAGVDVLADGFGVQVTGSNHGPVAAALRDLVERLHEAMA